METVNIHEARTRLTQRVEKAAAGKEIVVGRNGRPMARIARLECARRRIRFRLNEGKAKAPAEFDAPSSDAVLADFEGR